ncbi:hypothetical protein ABZX85_16160 [Streptomyces sp. NPDC004539]|uniref:hypothetical protein n=1 Tax=Streptomyces sp. NPDC004539 TaxID=3154280 RepID=UPI0033AEF885
MPDHEVRDLLDGANQGSSPTPERVFCDVPGELAWWRSKVRVSLFSMSTSTAVDRSADEDAHRLSTFLDRCHDDSDHAEQLRDAVIDRLPSEVGEGLFAATARKAGPFSALAYALGPDAALRLPGWFGEFLLDAEQVTTRTSFSTARCVFCAMPLGRIRGRPDRSAGTDVADRTAGPKGRGGGRSTVSSGPCVRPSPASSCTSGRR